MEFYRTQQFLAASALVYILAGFTKPFQFAFEVAQSLEGNNNPIAQMIDVHSLFLINAGLLDTFCYQLGRFTAFVI